MKLTAEQRLACYKQALSYFIYPKKAREYYYAGIEISIYFALAEACKVLGYVREYINIYKTHLVFPEIEIYTKDKNKWNYETIKCDVIIKQYVTIINKLDKQIKKKGNLLCH